MRDMTAGRAKRGTALVALSILLGLTAGCSGSDGEAVAGSTAAAPAVTSAPEETAVADECGAAMAEIQAAAQVSGFMTGVEVPTCAKAIVTTSLGTTPDDVDSAVGLCGNAANEAYSHGVAAVSIVSSSSQELAVGVEGSECTAVDPD